MSNAQKKFCQLIVADINPDGFLSGDQMWPGIGLEENTGHLDQKQILLDEQ
ncbi:hypothetical protein ACJJH9_13395 [Microbulbifer sp. DLAB2-AF]|uniref:hypothetical protein n=1 Tax=Microbulbifer sp. DLAB2-AF TaxID=3243395 RepID=UPI004039E72D